MSQNARLDEEQATQRRASLLGMDYFDTSRTATKQLFGNFLSVPEMYQLKVVPLVADQSNVLFGITTTTSQQTMQDLRQRFSDQRVTYAIISGTGFKDYMTLYDPPKQITYQDVNLSEGSNGQSLIDRISATLDQVRPDDILAYLVKQAYRLKASDIHLENRSKDVRVRFRVDGVLHPIAFLRKEKYQHLLSSIAVAANVSTSASDAQDGHINKNYQMATGENVTVNLRVETIPAAYGQDVVMRLFNIRMELMKLENLGLSENERKVVDEIISHPTGMVLIVGPTGSGKTTTLYSLINTLNSDERKILTLEDPIEYYMEGVVQIPVGGNTNPAAFAEKLKAILRFDPDVVMIGEIRDQDTAKTALQAALTGQLVLSSFHASSAAAALTRLVDYVGINPLFASAIHLIMAQRLVRRLDDSTKISYQPDEALRAEIKRVIDSLPPTMERPDTSSITLYQPGRSDANPFGYRGQIAIREQLRMSDGVRKVLRLPQGDITTPALEQQAVNDGMMTMIQDGVLKALQGITSIEEVYRVVG